MICLLPDNYRDAQYMDHGLILITLALIFAFLMAWGVGANDVANSVGTSVGSKAITVTQAIIIAAIFESLGAILAGGQVTGAISQGIINPVSFNGHPVIFVYGMLSALLATGIWLIIASRFGWPVSTTHSIIGAIIGFALFCVGPSKIHWSFVTNIVLAWIVTPAISGIIAFLLFRSVQAFIFNTKQPLQNAKRIVPVYIFIVTAVITGVTIFTGLKHLHINLSTKEQYILTIGLSLTAAIIGAIILATKKSLKNETDELNIKLLEQIFSVLMVFTACAMAFAHGSNDVANAMGPLAAIVNIVKNPSAITGTYAIPAWVMPFGAVGIVVGLAMYGHKIIATIGSEITQLTPSRGFAAQLATASTVIVASGLGLPISTTQALVGGVLGVGMARGMSAINLNVVRNILASWLITVPAGAVLSAIFFVIIRACFS